MDIIEVNECLRHWHGPPRRGTFDNTDVGIPWGGEPTQMVSPKEASKARVAAYQKAMEEATKVVAEAAANAAAEAAPEEPGRPGEPMVIELDKGESESHDEGAYAAFKEAIEVEDYEASDLEAL
jgi:hypothetical protein